MTPTQSITPSATPVLAILAGIVRRYPEVLREYARDVNGERRPKTTVRVNGKTIWFTIHVKAKCPIANRKMGAWIPVTRTFKATAQRKMRLAKLAQAEQPAAAQPILKLAQDCDKANRVAQSADGTIYLRKSNGHRKAGRPTKYYLVVPNEMAKRTEAFNDAEAVNMANEYLQAIKPPALAQAQEGVI